MKTDMSNAIIIVDPRDLPDTPYLFIVPEHRIDTNQRRAEYPHYRARYYRNAGYRFGWVVKEIKNEQMRLKKQRDRLTKAVLRYIRIGGDKEPIIALLSKYGAKNIPGVQHKDWDKLETDLKKLLENGQ